MKISRIIPITISNNLARSLLSVFCASEAQVPKTVTHQMQHLFDEKKKIREVLLFRVHTPGICWKRLHHCTLNLLEETRNTYTWTPAPKSAPTAASVVGCKRFAPRELGFKQRQHIIAASGFQLYSIGKFQLHHRNYLVGQGYKTMPD